MEGGALFTRYKSLVGLTDKQLVQLFRQHRNDVSFLERLNQELKKRTSDAAVELQIEVVMLLRVADGRAAGPALPTRSGPVREWLSAYFGARGLSRPNGEPLYRYRMTDTEYGAAKRILRELAKAGRLVSPDLRAGALFVAFCAEWFRRESCSTFLRWNELAPDIFPSVPYASKQELTQYGLNYWRRPLKTSSNGREFLLTLALEGGFPVRVLTENERGWLSSYLRTIMRRAIVHGLVAHKDILAIADEERGRMRTSYRRDDFVELCAELAGSLIRLRQEAEAAGGGSIANSAVLDVKHPRWRDELPLYVPAEDEKFVSELLTGLLNEKMTGLSTAGVEARRFLVHQEGHWQPAVQILADGEVSPRHLPAVSANGRMRAVPYGELGKYVPGEVALLEPPIAEQRRWRVHPSSRMARLVVGYPFTASVTVSLTTAEDVPMSWTWPRGEALRSDVLVFEEDEGSTSAQPLLRLVRAGSFSSPAKILHVLVPTSWLVEAEREGAVADETPVPSIGRKLIRLTGTAYFRANESEARFRVEPDKDCREQDLELTTAMGSGFEIEDERIELALSPVVPAISEARGQVRKPRAGELFYRRPGGRWQPLHNSLNEVGLFELSWRDPQADIQIEKRLLALVPQDARIRGTMTSMLTGEILLDNLPGWKAWCSFKTCTSREVAPGRLVVEFSGRPIYRLPVTLQPPGSPPFGVLVPLTGKEAAIVLADGEVLRPGARIDLSQLRGAVAISPRQTFLQVAPKGSKTGFSNVVDGELPLGIVKPAIDETFATLPHQDDVIELEFKGDTRLPIRLSRYRYDQVSIVEEKVRWTPPTNTTARLVARMLLKPVHEHELEPDGTGLWRLPERCTGPCLVYLREGIDVVSRPAPLVKPGLTNLPAKGLASCISIADHDARQQAIILALERFGQGQSETEDVEWLLGATLNLNGLPASAFDALKLLPNVPNALIRLLISAKDEGDRAVLWALQDELPFMWMALPLASWKSVLETEYALLQQALEPIFGQAKAASMAVGRLTTLRDELMALEPGLASAFACLGLPTAQQTSSPPLRELASRYVAAQHHREGEEPNTIAPFLAARGIAIPKEIGDMSHESFAGLFAPVLLALSALGRISLDREQSLTVRRTTRSDPAYVAGAWPHLLKFYS